MQWAVGALSEGWDSPALVRLSALDLDGEPSVFEALSLFHEACAQLAIPLASGKEAVLREYLFWPHDNEMKPMRSPMAYGRPPAAARGPT